MLEGKRHEKNILQLLNNGPFDGSQTGKNVNFSYFLIKKGKEKTLMDTNRTM
jgi:hypothetical protein